MSDPNTTLGNGDAFLLGYLPHRVGAHFRVLELLMGVREGAAREGAAREGAAREGAAREGAAREGAGGDLAARVETRLTELPERGPEIVSCVWQVQNVVGSGLRVEPPPPPKSPEEAGTFARAVEAAFASAPGASSEACRAAYALGTHCGIAERLATAAALQWELWTVAPGDARLGERALALREWLARFAAAPGVTTDDPTVRSEADAVTSHVAAMAEVASRPPDDASAGEIAQLHARLGRRARASESAARGTPRASIRAWRAGGLSGGELMRRLAEHASWHVPARLVGGQPEPLVLTFDKTVLPLFGDSRSYDERPAFAHAERPEDDLFLTLPGVPLFRWLQEAGVDVLVVDPTNDPSAPHTINYPREMHGRLRQVADEVAFELAACDWSRLDPAPLRDYSFWILVSGGSVHNLVAHDTFGRPFVSFFSSEEALDAHLARATSEQAREYALWQRMLAPGSVLFPPTLALDVAGIALNPSGPGRTRWFNTRTVEQLVAASG